jgi:hypothetical protein
LQLTGELLGVPLVRLEQSQTLLQQCLQVGILRVRNESPLRLPAKGHTMLKSVVIATIHLMAKQAKRFPRAST